MKTSKMKLSINIGWFADQHPSKDYGLDFYNVPGILKKAGFDALEYYPSVACFSPNPEYINKIVKSAGLYFYSGHLPMVGGQLSFDKKIYDERLKYIKDWIDYFAKLGIRVAVVHPDEGPFPIREHPARTELCVKWAHNLARYAKKHNMKIAVETTWDKGSLFSRTENIKFFRDRIRADNLGFCFDTGHAYGACSPAAIKDADENFWNTWDIVKDKVFNFHLHNTNKCSDLHNPFWMGGIDFKKFLSEVEKMNYDFPLTIEMNPVKALGPKTLLKKLQNVKGWAENVNNGNIENALKATAKMFKKYSGK
jgi:sugar phosphate isomerase/epimerase